MDDIKKVDGSVMVVEDSTTDRYKFRSILEMLSVNYCFAWDARKQKVPDVDEIMELINKIKPSTLLLDLSWTTIDDRLLQKLLFKDKDEIEELKIKIEKGSDELEEKTWISGFLLLERIKEIKNKKSEEHIGKMRIFVTTQYIPPVAYGLREYLWKEFSFIKDVIHKWRDQSKLMDKI